MRTHFLCLVLIFVSLGSGLLSAKERIPQLRTGDIIFQGTYGVQSQAVFLATHSKWTHCGIVLRFRDAWWVLEASRTTQLTPLKRFISRSSKKAGWAIYRYKDQVSDEKLQAALAYGRAQLGKPYDLRFAWGESHQYCSELVWKVYQAAGVTLCKPKTFKDYDLSSAEVINLIRNRYQDAVSLPANMKVVAPSDIATSDKLALIYQR